jgi:hypothetical protein
MSRIGIDLAGTAVFNLEAEFWADIQHLFTGKRVQQTPEGVSEP